MKTKISFTIDEQLLLQVVDIVEEGRIRNKSQIMEYDLQLLLRGELG
jgi:Arc/MetJ-type ribon-helix-helix transcriptional regulator